MEESVSKDGGMFNGIMILFEMKCNIFYTKNDM